MVDIFTTNAGDITDAANWGGTLPTSNNGRVIHAMTLYDALFEAGSLAIESGGSIAVSGTSGSTIAVDTGITATGTGSGSIHLDSAGTTLVISAPAGLNCSMSSSELIHNTGTVVITGDVFRTSGTLPSTIFNSGTLSVYGYVQGSNSYTTIENEGICYLYGGMDTSTNIVNNTSYLHLMFSQAADWNPVQSLNSGTIIIGGNSTSVIITQNTNTLAISNASWTVAPDAMLVMDNVELSDIGAGTHFTNNGTLFLMGSGASYTHSNYSGSGSILSADVDTFTISGGDITSPSSWYGDSCPGTDQQGGIFHDMWYNTSFFSGGITFLGNGSLTSSVAAGCTFTCAGDIDNYGSGDNFQVLEDLTIVMNGGKITSHSATSGSYTISSFANLTIIGTEGYVVVDCDATATESTIYIMSGGSVTISPGDVTSSSTNDTGAIYNVGCLLDIYGTVFSNTNGATAVYNMEGIVSVYETISATNSGIGVCNGSYSGSSILNAHGAILGWDASSAVVNYATLVLRGSVFDYGSTDLSGMTNLSGSTLSVAADATLFIDGSYAAEYSLPTSSNLFIHGLIAVTGILNDSAVSCSVHVYSGGILWCAGGGSYTANNLVFDSEGTYIFHGDFCTIRSGDITDASNWTGAPSTDSADMIVLHAMTMSGDDVTGPVFACGVLEFCVNGTLTSSAFNGCISANGGGGSTSIVNNTAAGSTNVIHVTGGYLGINCGSNAFDNACLNGTMLAIDTGASAAITAGLVDCSVNISCISNSGTLFINCGIDCSNISTCENVVYNNAGDVSINGDVICTGIGVGTLLYSYSGTVSITGNVDTQSGQNYAVWLQGGNTTITGNVSCSNTGLLPTLYIEDSATVTIQDGTVDTAGSHGGSCAIEATDNSTLNINGAVHCTNTNNAFMIHTMVINAGTTLNVVGTVDCTNLSPGCTAIATYNGTSRGSSDCCTVNLNCDTISASPHNLALLLGDYNSAYIWIASYISGEAISGSHCYIYPIGATWSEWCGGRFITTGLPGYWVIDEITGLPVGACGSVIGVLPWEKLILDVMGTGAFGSCGGPGFGIMQNGFVDVTQNQSNMTLSSTVNFYNNGTIWGWGEYYFDPSYATSYTAGPDAVYTECACGAYQGNLTKELTISTGGFDYWGMYNDYPVWLAPDYSYWLWFDNVPGDDQYGNWLITKLAPWHSDLVNQGQYLIAVATDFDPTWINVGIPDASQVMRGTTYARGMLVGTKKYPSAMIGQ